MRTNIRKQASTTVVAVFALMLLFTVPQGVFAADISDYTYSGNAFSYTSQTSSGNALAFSDDGTYMYLSQLFTNTNVFQYTLSTPWDVTTATYTRTKAISHNGITGLYFNTDGTKMYSYYFYSRIVYEYSLSTPWDISTATQTDTQSASTGNNYAFTMKADGTAFYVVQSSNPYVVRQFNMSAWDLTTADGTADATVTLGASDGYYINGITFTADGSKMYLLRQTSGSADSSIRQYTLSTPWDVSTAVFDTGEDFATDGQSEYMSGMYQRDDNEDIYTVGVSTGNQKVFHYLSGLSAEVAQTGGSPFVMQKPKTPEFTVAPHKDTVVELRGDLSHVQTQLSNAWYEIKKEGIHDTTVRLNPNIHSFVERRSLECGHTYEFTLFVENSIDRTSSALQELITEACAQTSPSISDTAVQSTEPLSEASLTEEETTVSPVPPPFSRDLTISAEGEDVRTLQELLIEANAGPIARELARVGATGYFGVYTRNALSEYQMAHSLAPPAGYFGPITRTFIASQ